MMGKIVCYLKPAPLFVEDLLGEPVIPFKQKSGKSNNQQLVIELTRCVIEMS